MRPCRPHAGGGAQPGGPNEAGGPQGGSATATALWGRSLAVGGACSLEPAEVKVGQTSFCLRSSICEEASRDLTPVSCFLSLVVLARSPGCNLPAPHPLPGLTAQALAVRREKDEALAQAQMAAALSGGASWGFGEDAVNEDDDRERQPRCLPSGSPALLHRMCSSLSLPAPPVLMLDCALLPAHTLLTRPAAPVLCRS